MLATSIVLGAAAAAAVGRSAPASACAGFDSFAAGQQLPAVSKVGGLTISSVPANPIRIYDPAGDGIAGGKGAIMADTLMFETERRDFRKVRVDWMSFTPGPTLFTATDAAGAVLRKARLDGARQHRPLGYSATFRTVSRVILQNGGRESIIVRLCFSR